MILNRIKASITNIRHASAACAAAQRWAGYLRGAARKISAASGP